MVIGEEEGKKTIGVIGEEEGKEDDGGNRRGGGWRAK